MTSQDVDSVFVERLVRTIRAVEASYHRLVLLVAPVGSAKTATLRHASEHLGGHVVNVNLELSRHLLDLSAEQRKLRCARVLDDVLGPDDTTAFLCRTELLFDPAFQHDPLRLMQQLSRRRTVVAAWSGAVDGAFLTYAEPGHPEYRRCPVDGLVWVEAPRGRVC